MAVPSEQQIAGNLRAVQAKDLLRRGLKVQGRARRLLNGDITHPKRIDTGNLRSSIQVQLRAGSRGPVVRVGTNKFYARWVHDGTGIYGPRRRKITPRTAKALVFASRTHGQRSGKFRGRVVARSVKGIRRNQFLKDALSAARD